MKPIRCFAFMLVCTWFISCRTQQPLPNYIQDIRDTSIAGNVIYPELKVQKNDLLSIQVYSASTRPEISDALYNLPCAGQATSPGASANALSTVGCGYLVDYEGNIEYPRVGTLHVEGLTRQELANLVKRKINEFDSVLTRPSVIVRFLNLKFTVVGEVRQPGVISFPGERVNVFEALGLAGDITEFGLRNQVKVVREQDGNRTTGVIDLSSSKAFESPYFHLQQNDVVMVDPTPRKAKKAEQDVVLQRLTFGLSIITAFALVYNILK